MSFAARVPLATFSTAGVVSAFNSSTCQGASLTYHKLPTVMCSMISNSLFSEKLPRPFSDDPTHIFLYLIKLISYNNLFFC
jgi:hypothetical protein